MKEVDWLCCQEGSREYYAIPRSLIKRGIPTGLLTDLWIPPGNFINKIISGKKGRYHHDIKDHYVKAFNLYFMARKLGQKYNLNSKGKYDITFEKKAADWIKKEISKINPRVIFSYSYTSLEIFKIANKFKIPSIVCQINPGPEEAKIVVNAFKNEFGDRYTPTVPDEAYWARWYEELELSDFLVVNSKWSEKLLKQAGIPDDKIHIIPLSFDRPINLEYTKVYPKTFNRERPLKILYLGSISIRKGFHMLKKAMKELQQDPVILELVGDLIGPEELLWNLPSNIVYHGRKNNFVKDEFYKNADIFILPTLSDGFAITQLEAQYWKLPIIVTDRCGDIVINEYNGIILSEINSASIINSIKYLLDQPDKLSEFSENSINLDDYSLNSIGEKWIKLIN